MPATIEELKGLVVSAILFSIFIYCIFLLEGLMSLLRDMGKGYLALCSYNCKEAINILSHLPSHHYNTGWVLCQIGRAYFELAEYMQVGTVCGRFLLFSLLF